MTRFDHLAIANCESQVIEMSHRYFGIFQFLQCSAKIWIKNLSLWMTNNFHVILFYFSSMVGALQAPLMQQANILLCYLFMINSRKIDKFQNIYFSHWMTAYLCNHLMVKADKTFAICKQRNIFKNTCYKYLGQVFKKYSNGHQWFSSEWYDH